MKQKSVLYLLGFAMAVFFASLALIPFYFKERFLPPLDNFSVALFSLASAGLIVCYLFGYKKIRGLAASPSLIKAIIAFSMIFSIILVLIPPVGSGDIFNYILRSRILTEYGENPYLTTTSTIPQDLFYHYSPEEWHEIPMQYGPVFAFVSIGSSFLAQDRFMGNQLLLKIFSVLVHIGNILLIIGILSIIRPASKAVGVFLYAWNPLVLFEVANNAHNDILMAFFVLLSIFLYLKKKYLWVLPVLVCSILTKYVTLLLLPLFLYFVIKKVPREKLAWLILKTGFICLLGTVVFYWPFWEGWKIFNSLAVQTKLISFFNFSLIPMLIFGLTQLASLVMPIDIFEAISLVRLVAFYSFLIGYVCLMYKIIKNPAKEIVYSTFIIIISYVAIGVVSLQSWYFLWFFPLAALIDKKWVRATLFLLTAVGLLSYSPFFISLLLLLMFLFVVTWWIIKRFTQSLKSV
ncbi:MAG: hypothetical protein ABH835_03980 [Patescibacteria group bacterium]